MDASNKTPIEEINQAILEQIVARDQEENKEVDPEPQAVVEAEPQAMESEPQTETKDSDLEIGNVPNPNSVNIVSGNVPVVDKMDIVVDVVKEVPGGDIAGLVGESSTAAVPEESVVGIEALIEEIEKAERDEDCILLNSDDEKTKSVEHSSRTPVSKKRKKYAPSTRYQPARSGKQPKTGSQDENVKLGTSIEPEGKHKVVLDEYAIDEKFLRDNKLDEVYDWIEFQGWTEMFKNDEKVDKHQVAEFYRKVTKEVKGPFVYLNFSFKGQDLTVSSNDIANIFGIKHEGFDTFTKRQWPDGISDEQKEEMEYRVCNHADTNKTDLTTMFMDPKIKILHRLLVTTIMPRGSKPALLQIQDILVLDQMLRKQEVNLPKLIIHQMEYISRTSHVGYGRIVKRILQIQKVYQPRNEETVLKPLTMQAIHNWGILFDKNQGWIRKEVPPQKPKAKGEEVSSTVLERLNKIDKEVSEVKGMLTALKDSVDKMQAEVTKMSASQWITEEEITGLKSLIKAGFAKRG